MSEIVEAYGVPDITADELANVRIIRNEMLFHYWAWQLTPSGILQKVLVARCRMPVSGVYASRPKILAALEGFQENPSACQMAEGATAH
jgi:hypothetical protein